MGWIRIVDRQTMNRPHGSLPVRLKRKKILSHRRSTTISLKLTPIIYLSDYTAYLSIYLSTSTDRNNLTYKRCSILVAYRAQMNFAERYFT